MPHTLAQRHLVLRDDPGPCGGALDVNEGQLQAFVVEGLRNNRGYAGDNMSAFRGTTNALPRQAP